jgi:hypothetical protein
VILKHISAKVFGWAMAVLGVVIAYITARQSGKTAARVEAVVETAAASKAMTDAAVGAPTDKADVVKDLRSGRF